MKATKEQLRAEVRSLRFVGAQMANLCFNLGQNALHDDLGRMVKGHDLFIMYGLSRQWDGISRTEVDRKTKAKKESE